MSCAHAKPTLRILVFQTMDPDNLDTTPSVPPPPGRTSNFIDPESRSYQLYNLIAFLSALVFVTVSLRLYTRLKITRSFGVDDC